MSLDHARREKLQNQARMLAVGHYVVGAIVLLFSLFFLVYAVLGGVFVFADIPTQPNDPPPWLFGAIFGTIGGCGALSVLALAIANFIAGMNLTRQRGRTLILVVAVFNLMHQPLGLVLGILSLLFLVQSDVKELFDPDDDELLD